MPKPRRRATTSSRKARPDWIDRTTTTASHALKHVQGMIEASPLGRDVRGEMLSLTGESLHVEFERTSHVGVSLAIRIASQSSTPKSPDDFHPTIKVNFGALNVDLPRAVATVALYRDVTELAALILCWLEQQVIAPDVY